MARKPAYDITGSYFENLRIAGHPIDVKLATHVFHDHDTYSKVAKAHHARKTDEWLVGGKLTQLNNNKLAELEDEYHALTGMSELVKEWNKPKRPDDRGSYWFSPANHLDWKAQGGPSEIQGFGSIICIPKFGVIRLAEMIVHHHSRTLTHVSGADVLFRPRHVWGRKHRRFYASYLTWIFALLVFSITGCKDKRASLERRYAEARLLFQQGYIEQPLPLAEAGFKESASYPDLNWKFRVLTAEARTRKGQYDAALEVLDPEPPSNIPSEIFWRRRITQALSLCKSGKYPRAEERFAQAAALHAEPGALDYARGRCAEFQHELKDCRKLPAAGYCAKLKPRSFSQGLCAGNSRLYGHEISPLRRSDRFE